MSIYKLIDLPGNDCRVNIEVNGHSVHENVAESAGLKYVIDNMGEGDVYHYVNESGKTAAISTRSQLVEEVERANTYLTERGHEPHIPFEPSNWPAVPGFSKNKNKRRNGRTGEL